MTEICVEAAKEEDLAAAAELLASCFPGIAGLDRDALAWSYLDNPAGRAIHARALDGERLVAQVALRPLNARVHGTECTGLLVQHAATASDFRMRGLFVQLVEAALVSAHEQGHAFAVAASSRASLRGFLNKLRFTEVAPLDVRVALGAPAARDVAAPPSDFEVTHDSRWSAWRTAPPHLPYRFRQRGDLVEVWCDSGSLGIPVLLTELPADQFGSGERPEFRPRSPLHVWVGLDPARCYSMLRSVQVPLRLRPSPLRLIFRAIAPDFQMPGPGQVRFDAIDFDAW